MKHQLLFALAQFIIDGFTAHKTLIVLLVIGMATGVIAQLVLPGKGHGLVITAIIGILGCYLSNMFVAKHITFVDNHIAREFIGAILVTMILSIIANMVIPHKARDGKQSKHG